MDLSDLDGGFKPDGIGVRALNDDEQNLFACWDWDHNSGRGTQLVVR